MLCQQSTLGIWFLHRRRFPVIGLLKVAVFALATYTTIFYVRADRRVAASCDQDCAASACCPRSCNAVAAMSPWQIHFWALPKTGDRADAFVPVEFSEGYEKTLINHAEYETVSASAPRRHGNG